MNTLQKALVVTGLVIVLVLGMNYPRSNPVVQQVAQQFGAVPSLDGVDNPSTSINGVRIYYVNQNFVATSTQVCRMKNPFNATSTVVWFSAQVTGGILGANKFSLSTSSAGNQGFATSTPAMMYEHSVASNAKDSIMWYPGIATTTGLNVLPTVLSTGESSDLLGPQEVLVWAIGSSSAGTVNSVYYTGNCKAAIRAI